MITRKQCAELLLEMSVRLNKDKLEARLKPRRTHSLSTRVSAYPWLLMPFDDKTMSLFSISGEHWTHVKTCVDETLRALENLRGTGSDKIDTAWMAVLLSVSQLHASVKDRTKYAELVEGSSIGEQLHQISQLARYAGLCRTLSKLCRQYTQHFSATEIVIVRPYRTVCGTWRTSMKLYVHAEVCLITHHELQRTTPKPRVIGSSRSACYLCESFVRAHGQYFITSTHHTFFTRWTVPDLIEFKEDTRKRYSEALNMVNRDVLAASKASGKYLLASGPWINLSVADLGRQLLSPILSSIASRISSSEASANTLKDENPCRMTPDAECQITLDELEENLGESSETTAQVANGTSSDATSVEFSEQDAMEQRNDNDKGESALAQKSDTVSCSREMLDPSSIDCLAGENRAWFVSQDLELFLQVDTPYDTLTGARVKSIAIAMRSPPSSIHNALLVEAMKLPTAEPGFILAWPEDGRKEMSLILHHRATNVALNIRCD